VGEKGRLYSFELREEFAEIASANVKNFIGNSENWTLTLGAFQEQAVKTIGEAVADRVVLDMLAPWDCVDEVASVLKPGGLVIIYVATVTQLSRTAEAIKAHGGFTDSSAWESLVRPWHLEGLAVRPEHRMIGHTGFLLSARRLAPNTQLPQFKQRRASKAEHSAEDMEIWLPEAIGQRPVSEKKLRKTVRKLTQELNDRQN
jgi:tRNA (adenine57-N1/adenine58-N1)-methyltransferase